MLTKQPGTVNKEIIRKINSLTTAGQIIPPTTYSKEDLKVTRMSELLETKSQSHVDRLLDISLEPYQQSHQLNGRSVIHSYLSRNPRIIKHIKGGMKRSDLLGSSIAASEMKQEQAGVPVRPPVTPGEESKKWTILRLIQQCCMIQSDEPEPKPTTTPSTNFNTL